MKTKRWLSILMVIAVLAVFTLPAMAAQPNLITNGDFESGNEDFTTEYTYLDPAITGSWELGPEYMYTVGTNPNLYHSAWASFGDHTTGVGKMMIVNGTYQNNETKIVWSQEDISIPAPETVVTSRTLYAGKNWAIGEVLIKNNVAGKICVKFVLTDSAAIDEGWIITEAHVAVAANCAGIPQTKKGNPIPGQFPVNVTIDPGVTETEWFCLDYAWTAGIPICIAAHANIERPKLYGSQSIITRQYDSETGWGDGIPFPGKNWATCMQYTPQAPAEDTYRFSLWARSSHPTQPGILQVTFNGAVKGTLGLTSDTSIWQQLVFDITVNAATSVDVVLRDLRLIAFGDDFCIDDISLVRIN